MTVRLFAALAALTTSAACAGGSPAAPSAEPSARYRVTFAAAWSAGTHPMDFPATAHFSGLVGATHRTPGRFWMPGGSATEGIRAMAERGSKSPLTTEVDQAIAGGAAEYLLSGGAVDRSPGSVTLDFDITQAHSLVTLVSMIAPSPDWFVGVQSLPLFENGAWRDTVQIDLYPYDAGTDSGVTFLSPDEETLPRAPIARITTAPFLNGPTVLPIGTFTFRRLR